MTKPLKHLYRIQYNDNTYQYVEWTKTEFNDAWHSIEGEKATIKTTDGIFLVSDIRAIVFIPPAPVEEEPTEEEKETQLHEWDFTGDPEIYQDLKALGLIGGDK